MNDTATNHTGRGTMSYTVVTDYTDGRSSALVFVTLDAARRHANGMAGRRDTLGAVIWDGDEYLETVE